MFDFCWLDKLTRFACFCKAAAVNRRRATRRTMPLCVEHLEGRNLLAAVPADIVSWFRAEGDALDFVDGNHGTLQNGTDFAPGLVGQAFRFDGVDDFVEVPDAANLDYATGAPFSIELWAFRTSTASVQHLLGKRSGNSAGDYNYQLPFENVDLPLNTWTHVAHAFDGDMYRVYFNGVLFTKTAVGNRIGPENDATLRIGTSGSAQPFGGLIDELRLYDRAISQAEIQAIVSAGSEGKATFEFAQAQYEVREGEPTAVLTVRRTGNLDSSGSVEFTTVSGTAGQRGILAGRTRVEDFTTTSGTLFFRSRSTVATIRVPIRDDATLEPDESFRVVLSNPTAGAELGAITSAEVILHDNDPTVFFAAASRERSEANAGRSLIEVKLQPASNQTVTVAYAVGGGSATLGTDFTLDRIRTLTFRPGQTRKFISFTTINDALYEGDETAIIELSSPTNAFLGGQLRHRVTIVDNDPQPPPVDPGPNSATPLAIDLATLPRQSYQQFIGRGDVDTFKVELGPREYLALDVDPLSIGLALPALPSSKLRILDGDGTTVLATIGASAEPEGGRVTNNAAHLFQADADGGTYYIQLSTTATGKSYAYSLGFHRLGISENVPSPEILSAPGAMYAWFDGRDTVGITGPTGYGFKITGPWQQQTSTLNRNRLLSSQTLTMPAGVSFELSNNRGLSIPLHTNSAIVISTKTQRWGNLLGEVSQQSIAFDTSTGMNPLVEKILFSFGPQIEFQTLNEPWELAMGSRIRQQRGISLALPGVPYLLQHRPFHIDEFRAALGDLSFKAATDIVNKRTVLVDFADPMLYMAQDNAIGPFQKPALAFSLNGNLPFESVETPSADVPAELASFFGHVYASVAGEIKIISPQFKLPLTVKGNLTVNLDADGDGQWLGGLGNAARLFAGDLSAQIDVLHDIQVGANASVNTNFNQLSHKLDVEMELGQASLVIDGPDEALWIKGRIGPAANPFRNSSLDALVMTQQSKAEIFVNASGEFFVSADAEIRLGGVELGVVLQVSNDGISARVTGRAEWSVKIDYGVGTVSGKAIAEIEADLAIEIDDDGDVHLSGSVSASGKLRYQGNNLFSGSIDASVRSNGFRFRFPRGVGNIDLDLF